MACTVRSASGTLILTLANYWTEATALYPILYTWIVLYAFYFFALREALAHLAFVALCYSMLLVHPGPVEPGGAAAPGRGHARWWPGS